MGYQQLIENKIAALNATISGLSAQITTDTAAEALHNEAIDGLSILILSGQRTISKAQLLKDDLNDILLSGLSS
jgi:hypothetical protein